MLSDISLYSYLAPAVAYLVLTTLLVISWRGSTLATLLVLACGASTLWAFTAAAQTATPLIPTELCRLAQLLRTGLWCLFLLKLLEQNRQAVQRALRTGLILTGVTATIALLGLPLLAGPLGVQAGFTQNLAPFVWAALALAGLLLAEEIYRHAKADQRWAVWCLCLGMAVVFGFDLFMYSGALLSGQTSPQIWQARGLINALVVPLIAISVARNLNWNLHIHLSRHVVFQGVMFMGTGLYLILMAVTGYYIRFYGGAWGGVIQIGFLCLTGAVLVMLLCSDRIRARIRVFLSKHFLSYKYDYRREWSRFTENLTSSDERIPRRVVSALAQLVQSNSGLLWLRAESGFELLEQWNTEAPSGALDKALDNVARFSERQQWVIDVGEYRQSPGLYSGLELTEALLDREQAWLLIPLFFGDSVIGIVLLDRPELRLSVNWEDHDLLKVAGRQAASELAQYQFNQQLVEARQFEAFNRLSAYVVHDLKNILAQQSLIVANAEKHKDNPDFIDDMVGTVNNSVDRMKRLMDQMRSGMRGLPSRDTEINELLAEVVGHHSGREPTPKLKSNVQLLTTPADREQLATVFGHIIQNAQEACRENGLVEVELEYQDDFTAVVSVRDNGIGMDEDFIRERLFRPFDSTKGLTGMGVGAFESREYIRSLGGDIEVRSTPGEGSLFRIVIPCRPSELGVSEWPMQETTY